MLWWLWLLVGLVLLGVEMMTPGGFYVLLFGVSALVVGGLVGLGVGGPVWLQWIVFSALSVGSLLLLRPHLMRWTRSTERADPMDTLEGEVAILTEDLAPGAFGKAELRGTAWTALNRGATPLARGQRCRVVRVDGLTLWVQAAEGGSS